MRRVPTNPLQWNLHKQKQEVQGPTVFAEQDVPCIIVKLFDKPGELHRRQARDARVYARILLTSGAYHVLPIRGSNGATFGLEGNSEAVVGRRGRVYFKNNNIMTGEVVLAGEINVRNADLDVSTRELSIGGIV